MNIDNLTFGELKQINKLGDIWVILKPDYMKSMIN